MSPDETRIAKALGAAVRQLRDQAGLSQIELAEKADLNHNFVGELERAEGQASVATVVKLATAFRMKGAELLARAKL